jgi:hypothetical protein
MAISDPLFLPPPRHLHPHAVAALSGGQELNHCHHVDLHSEEPTTHKDSGVYVHKAQWNKTCINDKIGTYNTEILTY